MVVVVVVVRRYRWCGGGSAQVALALPELQVLASDSAA